MYRYSRKRRKIKVQHFDRTTGDALTTGEYISWLVQGVIRRWTFLIIVTAITIAIWTTDNSTALTWWNLGASYLAIVIESVVGIAMFSQTKRDAVILREIRDMSQEVKSLTQKIEAEESQEVAELAEIERQIEGNPLLQRSLNEKLQIKRKR